MKPAIQLTGINDFGSVVGNYNQSNPVYDTSFLVRRGKLLIIKPDSSEPGSDVYGIDNHGDMIVEVPPAGGEGATANANLVTVSGTRSKWQGLNTPNDSTAWANTYAYGISPNGLIAGEADGSDNQGPVYSGVVLWRKKASKSKSWSARLLEKSSSFPIGQAVDRYGDVAGYTQPFYTGPTTGRLWSGKGKGVLLQGSGSFPRGIVALGPRDRRQVTIVGTFQLGRRHPVPYLWKATFRRGKIMSISSPRRLAGFGRRQAADGAAMAINSHSWIVGEIGLKKSARAVLWLRGRPYNLNTRIPRGSGWTLREATGVNVRGQIIGVGRYHGRDRGFILTPKHFGRG
jgi:hypothetical protein